MKKKTETIEHCYTVLIGYIQAYHDTDYKYGAPNEINLLKAQKFYDKGLKYLKEYIKGLISKK
jgi:hypothetical protein